MLEPGTPCMNLRFLDENDKDFNHQSNTIYIAEGQGWKEFNSLWLDVYNMNNSVTIEVHEGSKLSQSLSYTTTRPMAELIQQAGVGGQIGQEIAIGSKVKFKMQWEERYSGNVIEWQEKYQLIRYEGMTDQEGKPHGYGTRITYGQYGIEMAKYMGDFVHGLRHGEGTLIRPGVVEGYQIGSWVEDELNGEGKEFIKMSDRLVATDGIFKNNQLHDGKMMYFHQSGKCEIVFIDKGRKVVQHYYNASGKYIKALTF